MDTKTDIMPRATFDIFYIGCLGLVLPALSPAVSTLADDMPWIAVADDNSGFIQTTNRAPFTPWGFNYDHDKTGRLLEDYWEQEWPRVESDFAEMKELGANVVRIHLQFGKFMSGPEEPNQHALERLTKLVVLAERVGLYLDVTGLGCYHKHDVPEWYDNLDEPARWNAQSVFWKAVAARCSGSPAIFCYDLMNEPVVPGGRRARGDWLGPPFAGKHFVQFITLDQQDRPRPEIARAWTRELVTAIRSVDRRHLVTVGLVDWSLDRPGLTSGFVPEAIAPDLDFLAVHIYPQSNKVDEALQVLKGFDVGKPVLIEEIFPLRCSAEELDDFINSSRTHADGWIGFYWGETPQELRTSKEIGDAILLKWLDAFHRRAGTMTK